MTDCELLRLAAKAADIEVDEGGTPFKRGNQDGIPTCDDWNPLGDDGDALRLVIALDIDLTFDAYGCVMAGRNASSNGKWDALEDDLSNKASATRHAIVRAAAAIVRQPQSSTIVTDHS